MKILHTGDWHIGNFPGPEVGGENGRYLDIIKCLDALVEGARQQRPDIAVVAGDVFHQARVWSDRGLKEQQAAVKFLRELSDICPVVVVRGTPNHDSEEQFKTLESTFAGSDRVVIVTEPQVVDLATDRNERVQIACIPGFDRGYYRAKHPGLSKEEENEVFTKAIEDLILGLRAMLDDYSPAVLVSHFTITGCNMESGQTAFFSQFEPVVYPSTLRAADFSLVCFGHIHRPQQIEGVCNTFYCGAVSALNFNDEGQERGYWIHDMSWKEDAAGRGIYDCHTESTFHRLPTREYLTIRLTDEDVAAINAGDYTSLTDRPAADKVVRVLYSCTDEHNKAFSHAKVEQVLYYNGGAYWVQEVTPERITITVDRRSLEAEDTPEDNLASYLREKELPEERVAALLEQARPIIAEATEKATQERRGGLFVPVEIEVHNYRNYRDERFSFDGIRFCTINGSNGVGKSSLFMDAMLDALYEEPREGDLTGWICNDPEARSGYIKFTFKLGDRLFRVTRTRAKSGKATLNLAEQVDGEWTDRSEEKFRDTQQAIINTIGMDSLTLKACALIMQDQYGLFLQADKEARMNILGSILGLGIYAGMEELAADRATETNRAIRTLADKAETLTAGLPDIDELDREITALEQNRAVIQSAAQSNEASLNAAKARLAAAQEAAERAIRLNSRITSLTTRQTNLGLQVLTQQGALKAAEDILAEEQRVMDGVALYNALLAREKELLGVKAEYDAMADRVKQVKDAIQLADTAAKELRQKKAALTLTKLVPLKAVMARETELEAQHRQYAIAAENLKAMEEHALDYTMASAELRYAQDDAAKVEQEYETQLLRASSLVSLLEDKVELLEDSGCPDVEKASCKFPADAIKAKGELPAARERVRDVDADHEEKAAQAAASVAQAAAALELVKMYSPEEIDKQRAVVRALEAGEEEYSTLAATRQELEMAQERADELESSAQQSEETAAKGRETLEALEAKLDDLRRDMEDYTEVLGDIDIAKEWTDKEKKLPAARQQKASAEARLAELEQSRQELEAELAEARADLQREQDAADAREKLQKEADDLQALLDAGRALSQQKDVELGRLRQQKETAQGKVAQAEEMQQQMNELGVTAAGYEELKKAFSQDGIPHNIVRSIIPLLEATATGILGQMSQGHMSVEFVTEKVLKSNSKKEVTTLDIIINDSDTGRLPYMSRSGGERVKAALSVILALSEIKSSKAGVQLGFLFIDEPPFLDAPGVQAYCDALEAIQRRYTGLKIMAITHDPEMKARFPQSVDVVKTEAGSKVIFE